MPEGHSIHRLAREHRAAFAGFVVRAESPQGRFAAGAAALDGQVLEDVDAFGKHLLHRWQGGDVLHVHLGLIGVFRMHAGDIPAPAPSTRLRLAAGDRAADLAGPMTCELIDVARQEAIIAALGPDPLRRDADPRRFAAALARRSAPIGTVLLDQSVIAGVGNVFRSEALFAAGLHPQRPSASLSPRETGRLWATIERMLAEGLRRGRIVTVEPRDVGASRADDVPEDDRMLVYKRHGLACRRCGAAISSQALAGRLIWFCDACQPWRPARDC